MPSSADFKFSGSVPANYDRFLGPMLFEPYALDLTGRLQQKYLRILELACGTGRVTNHLRKAVAPNGTLVATDLNPDMLTIAKEKVQGDNIEWKVVNAQELPFEPASFDVVVCQFGVMFFPDKQGAFSGIARALPPGGIFLFNTWERLEYNGVNVLVNDVLKQVLKDDAPDFMEKGPFSFFNGNEIREILSGAGFNNITLDTVKKVATVPDVDYIIQGFTTGSPLAAYLGDKPTDVRAEVLSQLRTSITTQFGEKDLQFPMQAIVCRAEKA